MEVKPIESTDTTKLEEKNETKEQVIGHGLGQELDEVKRQGRDPKMESSRRGDDDESLKNSKTEMMMKKINDDRNFRETPEMTEKEDGQKEKMGQRPEKSKEEDHQRTFRQDPDQKNGNDNKKTNHHAVRKTTKSHVWDCGSTLYDSFELNSFQRQLDSAISASSARSMSMPHLPDRRLPPSTAPPPPPPPPSSSSSGKKHSNKISRSLQKLLKSVFRPRHHQRSSSSAPSSPVVKDVDRYYVVYDKSGSLTTIPESAETDVGPPEISSLVRKTTSERFTAARVVGISCA